MPSPSKGRPPIPKALKALQHLTRNELIEIANIIVRGEARALQLIANDPRATALEKMIGSIVAEIIRTGDMQSFNLLLDRLIGKCPDKMDLGFNVGGGGVQIHVNLPSNGREQILNEPPPEPEAVGDEGEDDLVSGNFALGIAQRIHENLEAHKELYGDEDDCSDLLG